jgi:hypothetical protein
MDSVPVHRRGIFVRWKENETREREYSREGWPMLTVETEAKKRIQGVHMKGVLPYWFIGLVVLVQDSCPALAVLVSPIQNVFHTSFVLVTQ